MPTVRIKPSKEVPLPYDTSDVVPDSFAAHLQAAANTADMLKELGAPVEIDPATLKEEKELLKQAIKDKKVAPLSRLPTATAASSFLNAYGAALAVDLSTMRNALTNKLFEIANCGETKYELKALELLGKHSDIGLFTERSEININHTTPEGLEKAIRDRVKRLLSADVVDIKPLGMDLDEELGLAPADPFMEATMIPDAEYTDVGPEDDEDVIEEEPVESPDEEGEEDAPAETEE